MKRLLNLTAAVAILILASSALPASIFAKSADFGVPEVDGTYSDPSHPGTKVRVIVHKARTAKPGKPSVTPTLVCDLQDPSSSTKVPAGGWTLPANWTYNLNPGSVPSTVGGANLPTIADRGFGVWEPATGNEVNFSQGASTTVSRQAYDDVNVVAWGRTSGSALAVTYIRYNSVTKVAVDVDMIVNKSFAWYWVDQSGVNKNCAYSGVYDAQNILTHEFGHWVGLDDTYDASFTDNTMFGYGSKQEVKKDTLTSGDQAGAHDIYN